MVIGFQRPRSFSGIKRATLLWLANDSNDGHVEKAACIGIIPHFQSYRPQVRFALTVREGHLTWNVSGCFAGQNDVEELISYDLFSSRLVRDKLLMGKFVQLSSFNNGLT